MKTHRWILSISLLLDITPLIVVLITNKDSKLFQIFLGLMGTSIVAALLVIPNYLSSHEENGRRLYSSLLYIKIQLIVIENTINKFISSNGIITKTICDNLTQIINTNLNNLNFIDRI